MILCIHDDLLTKLADEALCQKFAVELLEAYLPQVRPLWMYRDILRLSQEANQSKFTFTGKFWLKSKVGDRCYFADMLLVIENSEVEFICRGITGTVFYFENRKDVHFTLE